MIILIYYLRNTEVIFSESFISRFEISGRMPKVSVDIPKELYDDLMEHVGENKKFVNLSEAIRTAIRKMLDQLDEIDRRHGRI